MINQMNPTGMGGLSMMGELQGTNYGLLGLDPTSQQAMGLLAAGGPLPMSGAAGMRPMGGMGMMPPQGMAPPQGTPQAMPQGPSFANVLQQLQQRMMAPGGAVPTPGGLGAPGGQQMGGLSPQLMQLLMGAGAQR